LDDEQIEADALEEAHTTPEDLGDSDDEDPMVDDVAQSALEHLTTAANEEVIVKIADTSVMSVDLATIVNGLRDLTHGPASWTPAPRKEDRGEPAFDDLDNPGKWTQFCFRPEFKKTSGAMRYARHSLPTGCIPVPIDNGTGKRIIKEWEFHYNGWTHPALDTADDDIPPVEDVPAARNGSTAASKEKMFPKERKGSLDKDKLKALGLTKQRMIDTDATFFYQLILPFCDPKMSGVQDDPRMAFYTDVLRFSNIYAGQNNLGTGPYGHYFEMLSLENLIHFDHGRNDSSIHRQWQKNCCAYDKDVDSSISHRRWLQVKRVIKLCDNSSVPKRGQDGYDPAYKYDFIWKAIIHNVNAITATAELDQCGDETTFGHGGYGETGTGLWGRLLNKPFTKGGQTVLISDVHRIRPRAYTHRHKCWVQPEFTKPWGKAQGPLEVVRIAELIMPMTDGFPDQPGVKKIFKETPHITWDNFFSGDHVMEWLGSKGFGATMTCRRDRLPSDIPREYLYKLGAKVDGQSKAF
jgi:hypothetical protein